VPWRRASNGLPQTARGQMIVAATASRQPAQGHMIACGRVIGCARGRLNLDERISRTSMSAFHKMIATVKSALERAPRPVAPPAHAPAPGVILPVAHNARRAELISQFARELEVVGGAFLGVFSPDEIRARTVVLAREIGARTAAIGAGVTLDTAAVARALEQAGITVAWPGKDSDAERASFRERVAGCDLGIVEANAGIAATGTLAVIGSPENPNSLTLLPPSNLIIVNADRMHSDLAAAVAAIGAATFTSKRVALITGPSRTADIEKMIVLGVHGPKKLYALAIWPHEL
jgi:L-lactate dehydrogenase complex protein LldG